jgi:glutamate--cysteine ligase
MKENGVTGTGIALAEQYRQLLINEPLEVLKPEDFARQAQESVAAQQQLEANDTLDFETYLAGREG